MPVGRSSVGPFVWTGMRKAAIFNRWIGWRMALCHSQQVRQSALAVVECKCEQIKQSTVQR
jgi:hypothetical protein